MGMLVISRNVGESFFVGDNIKVTIVDILLHKVKIGVEAPKEIVVLREELMGRDQVLEENIPEEKEL